MNDLDLIERICPSSKCNCGHPSYRCDECKGILSDYLYDHDAKVRAEGEQIGITRVLDVLESLDTQMLQIVIESLYNQGIIELKEKKND